MAFRYTLYFDARNVLRFMINLFTEDQRHRVYIMQLSLPPPSRSLSSSFVEKRYQQTHLRESGPACACKFRTNVNSGHPSYQIDRSCAPRRGIHHRDRRLDSPYRVHCIRLGSDAHSNKGWLHSSDFSVRQYKSFSVCYSSPHPNSPHSSPR